MNDYQRLRDALNIIRDSTFRNAMQLRAVAQLALESTSAKDENAEWRFEVCERLGMSCAAGATWTADEVCEHVRYLERMAAQ